MCFTRHKSLSRLHFVVILLRFIPLITAGAYKMNSGVLQNIPAFGIIIVCVAGIGAVPYGVHRLFWGERKVGRDDWDYLMDRRDARLLREKQKRLKAEEQIQ